MALHGGRGHAESKSSHPSEELLKYDSFHARHRLGRYDDIYTFEEVFSERPWCDRHNAVASIDMKLAAIKSAKNGLSTRPPIAANIYKVQSFIERPPLTADGYEQLRADLQKWNAFCEERVASIDRFAVGDFRSEEEQKEEEALQKRISKTYKDIAKENKRRAKEEKARREAIENGEGELKEPEPVQLDRAVTAETEDDSSSVVRNKKAAARAAQIAESHIADAFEEFAEENDRGSLFLYYSNIPLALIQMFATHVDYHVIDLALAEMGMNQRSPRGNNPGIGGYSAIALSLHEFRTMQGHVRMLLAVREEEELARRQREALPPPPADAESLSRSASGAKSKAKRVQTGPARLQKSDEDVPLENPIISIQPLPEDDDAFDGKGVVEGYPSVEGTNASFAENFVDGWSEADSQSHVLQEQGSLDRMSKTAPGKAQNAPRSWYEDDEEGGTPAGGSGNVRAAGSATEDLSKHSSSSYPQGSALQVAKAAKNNSKE
jgi:hypothetical protein